jgi:hypothetical protein
LAFIRRLEFSSERVAAFVKRIWTIAPLVENDVALGLLAFTRALMVSGEDSVWGEYSVWWV